MLSPSFRRTVLQIGHDLPSVAGARFIAVIIPGASGG
jgi:hypothetical protein